MMNVVVFELKAADLFMMMLRNCNDFELQPLLAKAMEHLGWDQGTSAVITTKCPVQKAVNLVASLLSVDTPVDYRDEILGVASLRPPLRTSVYVKGLLPSVSLLGCLFSTTYRFSDAIIDAWVDVEYWEMLVALVVPAFVEYIKSSGTMNENIEEWRVKLLTKIQAGFSESGSWALSIPVSWWSGCCAECDQLAAFLRSPTARTHTLAGSDRGHFRRFFLEYFTEGILATIERNDSNWRELQKKPTRKKWRVKATNQIKLLRVPESDDDSDSEVKRQKTLEEWWFDNTAI